MAVLLAAATWCGSALWLLVSLYVRGLGCDDHCGGAGWQNATGAWQWNAVLVAGVAVFLAGSAFLLFVVRQRAGAALAAFSTGAAVAVVEASLLWNDWWKLSEHPLNVLLAGATAAAGAVAMLLASNGDTRV